MKTQSIGTAVKIDNAPDGALLAFRRRGKTYLAIKLTKGQNIAVLWPHHPSNTSSRTGLLNVDSIKGNPIWLLPDDSIECPHVGLAHLHDKSEFQKNQGSLVLSRESPLVTVRYDDDSVAWVDLKTGDLRHNLPDGLFVWFPQWSIRLADPEGHYEVLCEIPGQASLNLDAFS